MNKHWIVGVAAVGALALPSLAYAFGQDGKPPVDTPKVETPKLEALKLGSVVPETLALPDMNGKLHSFKDLRGKVVIVHFWSDRCPAEKHGDPVVKKLEEHFAKQDVVLVGIASNQNELGAKPEAGADRSAAYKNLREKQKEIGHGHALLIDHGNVASDLFGAKTTPHCFVLDKTGKIAYVGALDGGPKESEKAYVRDAAEALLAGKPVPVAETKPYG